MGMSMRTVSMIICASLISLSLLLPDPAFSRDNLTLVYTNSLNGYLDFCHCKAEPNGGLVKRATEFASIRKSYQNILFLDTGDSFTYDPDPLGARYVSRAMAHIGYDAMVPGDQEFSIGVDEFMAAAKNLPFLCGNLQVNRGGRWTNPFQGYRMLDKAGIKTAIIGSLAPESFRFYPESVKRIVRVGEQMAELKRNVSEAEKKGASFIILLSHSGYERDLEIARTIKGIDVIIGGHSQTMIKNPVINNGALIVQAGSNGAHIGILELAVEQGKIVSYNNSFRRPDEFHPEDDPEVRRLITEYREKIKKEAAIPRFK